MILIGSCKYELLKNYKDAYNNDEFIELWTEFYETYDYILGDYAYGKLRLKGFNDSNNINFNTINDFKNVNDYIKNFCAYDCKYFILKRIDY